jgi:predicted ATPase
VVSDAVLTTAMRELRQALGDPARTPRFIQTVHGRGYRFIAPVTAANGFAGPSALRPLVGREKEWTRLQDWNMAVQGGKRRIGFIAGEAGIGKTALVEAFVSQVSAQEKVVAAYGQCIEHYGAGEAYMPLLEALTRIGRDGTVPLTEVLRNHAPSWLAHLPSLRTGDAIESPTPVTPTRMLRELADALEILTARHPLILVLEDLHWSDTATLEWLAYVARRRDPARLLILGTYRPCERTAANASLRRMIGELRQHPHGAELVLDYLSDEAVETYIRQRCGRVPQIEDVARMLRWRTAGHPLLLTLMVDEMIRDAADPALRVTLIPTSVRQFIQHRFELLSSDKQAILEAASVAGDSFSIPAAAAATSLPEDDVEATCASWARDGHFLIADRAVIWPDGTLSVRYRFRHALFPEALYEVISPERRARFHRHIGNRLERAYGEQTAAVAAELAMHFEQGRELHKAVLYLEQAARNALERSAYAEASRHLERGRELLEGIPENRQHLTHELRLLLLMGRVLAATKGWAVGEVESVFIRARDICQELGDTPRLLQSLWGLIGVTFVGADFRKAQGIGEQVLELAKKRGDPVYEILGHMEIGGTAFHLGESNAATAEHFREAEALYDPGQHRSHVACFGVDMGLFSRSWATHFLWLAGYPDRARKAADETLRLARELSHPLSHGVVLAYVTMLHQFCRDRTRVEQLAETTISLCSEHGFPYYLAWAEVLRGWSRAAAGAHDEGIGQIRGGIEALQAKAGARLSYYGCLLAEAYWWSGRNEESLQALTDAFGEIRKTGECWWESELHRLQGEILLLRPDPRCAEAEGCFHTAIEKARRQHAKSLELRAAVSLGRLWQAKHRYAEAQRLIEKVYSWFTEGFDTSDLREAELLLQRSRFPATAREH